MAAFFGGAAKAPIGAILMISEMTAGYGLLVPLMLTTAVAVALVPKRVSIYEEQVDGSLNSPAHLDRYLSHVLSGSPAAPAARPPETADDTAVIEARIAEDSPMVGRRLVELPLDELAVPLAIRRGDAVIMPERDVPLAGGDMVAMIPRPGKVRSVLTLFRDGPVDGREGRE